MLQTTDQPVLWTRSSSHGSSLFTHYRLVAEVAAPFVRTGPPQRLPPLDTSFPWQWKTLCWKMPLLWGASGLRMPVSALLCGPGYLAQRKGWWPWVWASMKYRVIVSIQELPPSARDNYLKQRKQRVVVNGQASETLPVLSGVPHARLCNWALIYNRWVDECTSLSG